MHRMMASFNDARRTVTVTPTWLALSAGIATLVAWYAAAKPSSAARAAVRDGLLIVIPLATAWVAFRTVSHAPPRVRTTWRLIGLAALLPAIGQLLVTGGALIDRPVGGLLGFVFYAAFHPLFAAAALLALGDRQTNGSVIELALDAALLLACGAVVMMRFGWEQTVLQGDTITSTMVWMLIIQLASLGSVFAATLLALWEDTALPSGTVAALVGATAAFTIGNILTAKGFGLAGGGTALDLFWIGGWVLLLGGALGGVRIRPTLTQRRHLSNLSERLTRVIVPSAALLLAVIAIDAVDDPLHPETAAALGLVGLLLAWRSGQALGLVSDGRVESVRLAHSQALIEVSHSLAVTTDLGRVLDTVSEWAARLVNAPAAGIELLHDDGRTLEIRSIWNLPPRALAQRFSIEESFTGRVLNSGIAQSTPDALLEPFLAREGSGYLGSSALAAAPIRFRERKLGVLFACLREDPFDGEELKLLQALADQAGIAIENAQLFEQVHELSVTDPLTGLANRRGLEQALAREFAAARRGRSLTVVLFDLDAFKRYNDRKGHLAGDEVLKLFGAALKAETRAMNLATRYGGDEFLALLTDTDEEGARHFVERVCERFAEVLVRQGIEGLGASAGIAEYDGTVETADELIRRADAALYAGKARRAVVG